jgi:hypothetical protein
LGLGHTAATLKVRMKEIAMPRAPRFAVCRLALPFGAGSAWPACGFVRPDFLANSELESP